MAETPSTEPGTSQAARWAPVALIALTAALVLPGLGGGLWEPVEVNAIEAARSGKGPHAPLSYALQAAGLRVLGAREVAARIPVAVVALGCVILAAWIGGIALGRRAGLFGAAILATSPSFLFEARLASSEILTTTAGLLAWGGVLLLGRIPLALTIAMTVVGLVVGTLSGGALVGAALPLCASGVTLLLAWPKDRPRRAVAAAVAVLALGLSAGIIALLFFRSVPASWIGGALRKVAVPPSFDTALKTLAHGAFPWSGLLPVALLHLFGSGDSAPSPARAQVLSVLVAGFAISLLASWRIHEIRYPALVACSMAVGVYLDDALRGQARPFAALLAACGVAILARDLFLSPESLLDAQRLEGVKYPIEMHGQMVHLGFGLAFAFLVWIGIGWSRRALVGLVIALPYAAFAAHGLMPELGKHLSSKGLLAAYQQVAKKGEPLAKYRVPGRGVALGPSDDLRELRTQLELLEYLRAPGRVFALVPAGELAALDQAARRADTRYVVLDDSSSRALLVSNRMGKGEKDRNALRLFVFKEPTKPRHPLKANFEGMVELIGYDLPPSAKLGGKLKGSLHFHVTGKLPPNWKLFVHFDAPAYRVHGDHVPLDGKLPTQYWSVGDYIVDEFEVDVPRMTTPSGRYTAFMGFWLGDKRLKVTEGPNDGSDRVRLGTVQFQ